jgi:hypothetical protein
VKWLLTNRRKKARHPRPRRRKQRKKTAREVDTSKPLKDLMLKKKHEKGKLALGGAMA